MSTLVLSLLLLLLIVAGMLMAKPIREHFVDAPADTHTVSPALVNLLGTPRLAPKIQPLQVDTLAREHDLKVATECPACPACPAQNECSKCPVCPDMSQYIRLDEIPCWNCSLP